MHNTKIILIALFFTFSIFASCKKTSVEKIVESDVATNIASKIPDNFFAEGEVPDNPENSTYVSNATAPPSGGGFDPNNGDVGIVLGNQLVNPYTLQNMQNAVNILNGTNAPTVVANYLYVRFKPTTPEQIEALEDNDELELQDYPMDYAVLQDGDYYQDPSIPTESIPWLYSSVPSDFVAPAGIQYEIISPLYIPTADTLLETMAESIAAGATYRTSIVNGNIFITRLDKIAESLIIPFNSRPSCLEGYHLVLDDNGHWICVPNNCPEGYYWDGTRCVPIPPPPPPPPPPLPPGIYVEEQRACGTASTVVPLRQARIVCKRWFKIWRGYTNDIGRFNVTKRFKNNVKIIIKTKNDAATVSKVRGLRLWQMYFPCKKKLGVVHNSELASFRYVFTKPTNGSGASKELAYWAATTTHNSILEFREYATEMGIALPPADLKIMMSNWGGGFRATGAAPMFNKCHGAMNTYFARHFIMSQSFLAVGDLNTLVASLTNRVDILINYLAPNADYNCRLTSTWIKELAYHEFGHAAHYTQAGCGFWQNYRTAVSTELSKTNQADFHPYGTGSDASTAPVLAIGEMWGNHCQYIFADRHFGNGGAASNVFTTTMQTAFWANPTNTLTGVNTTPTLNCHLAALESHNPNSVDDTWPWIPQGLPYDLIDNRNDNNTNTVIDNVSGFTNTQIFNALQPDIQTIVAFRNRLLLNNGNNQQTEVNQLFNEYNY